MSKSKQRHIKIPLPKWTWWQSALVIAITIIAYKSDPNNGLKIVKELLMKWLMN